MLIPFHHYPLSILLLLSSTSLSLSLSLSLSSSSSLPLPSPSPSPSLPDIIPSTPATSEDITITNTPIDRQDPSLPPPSSSSLLVTTIPLPLRLTRWSPSSSSLSSAEGIPLEYQRRRRTPRSSSSSSESLQSLSLLWLWTDADDRDTRDGSSKGEEGTGIVEVPAARQHLFLRKKGKREVVQEREQGHDSMLELESQQEMEQDKRQEQEPEQEQVQEEQDQNPSISTLTSTSTSQPINNLLKQERRVLIHPRSFVNRLHHHQHHQLLLREGRVIRYFAGTTAAAATAPMSIEGTDEEIPTLVEKRSFGIITGTGTGVGNTGNLPLPLSEGRKTVKQGDDTVVWRREREKRGVEGEGYQYPLVVEEDVDVEEQKEEEEEEDALSDGGGISSNIIININSSGNETSTTTTTTGVVLMSKEDVVASLIDSIVPTILVNGSTLSENVQAQIESDIASLISEFPLLPLSALHALSTAFNSMREFSLFNLTPSEQLSTVDSYVSSHLAAVEASLPDTLQGLMDSSSGSSSSRSGTTGWEDDDTGNLMALSRCLLGIAAVAGNATITTTIGGNNNRTCLTESGLSLSSLIEQFDAFVQINSFDIPAEAAVSAYDEVMAYLQQQQQGITNSSSSSSSSSLSTTDDNDSDSDSGSSSSSGMVTGNGSGNGLIPEMSQLVGNVSEVLENVLLAIEANQRDAVQSAFRCWVGAIMEISSVPLAERQLACDTGSARQNVTDTTLEDIEQSYISITNQFAGVLPPILAAQIQAIGMRHLSLVVDTTTTSSLSSPSSVNATGSNGNGNGTQTGVRAQINSAILSATAETSIETTYLVYELIDCLNTIYEGNTSSACDPNTNPTIIQHNLNIYYNYLSQFVSILPKLLVQDLNNTVTATFLAQAVVGSAGINTTTILDGTNVTLSDGSSVGEGQNVTTVGTSLEERLEELWEDASLGTSYESCQRNFLACLLTTIVNGSATTSCMSTSSSTFSSTNTTSYSTISSSVSSMNWDDGDISTFSESACGTLPPLAGTQINSNDPYDTPTLVDALQAAIAASESSNSSNTLTTTSSSSSDNEDTESQAEADQQEWGLASNESTPEITLSLSSESASLTTSVISDTIATATSLSDTTSTAMAKRHLAEALQQQPPPALESVRYGRRLKRHDGGML